MIAALPDTRIIAATGHRPNKLGGYSKEAFTVIRVIAREWLKEEEPDATVSGLALGWDMAVAVASYDLGIPFDAYIPFEGQQSRWPEISQKQWQWIVDRARLVKICSEGGYEPWKMQVRNKAMADDSSEMLAMWNGTSGGTANCVAYATKIGRPVTNLWDRYRN